MRSYKRILRGVLHRGCRVFNLGLHHLELLFSPGCGDRFSNPPIFIIGAPRSGSTLLYQVLTEYYDVGYLSNLHAYFYGAPSLIERHCHPLQLRRECDFKSENGQSGGLAGPSECGLYWYRFFRRRPQYVPLGQVGCQRLERMRRSVGALLGAFGRPVLFKNLNCALRLEPLGQTLPEALFIVMRRDVLDNAHSLLEGRKKVYGDYARWWSLEPPNVDALRGLPPHEQVVEQVLAINTLIDRDKGAVGASRFIDVNYEHLCKDVRGTLWSVDVFLSQHGVRLSRREQANSIPSEFPRAKQRIPRIPAELYNALVKYVQEKTELMPSAETGSSAEQANPSRGQL